MSANAGLHAVFSRPNLSYDVAFIKNPGTQWHGIMRDVAVGRATFWPTADFDFES